MSGERNASLRAKWQTPDPPYESMSVETDMDGATAPTTFGSRLEKELKMRMKKRRVRSIRCSLNVDENTSGSQK